MIYMYNYMSNSIKRFWQEYGAVIYYRRWILLLTKDLAVLWDEEDHSERSVQ
jgi:hypothetical protein